MSRRNAFRVCFTACLATSAASLLFGSQPASAGIVPTVLLGTAADYSVLGATTVTNTNPSVIGQSVGLSPGSAIVGFPPGIVLPPATIEAANAVTLQAQSDLTTAYVDAAGRPVEFTQVNPDLVGQTLLPGVYAGTAKAPLGLSGQLVLDGQGNSDAVFIFQTDSTLITSTGSTIALINGASECNVFWQVGSSATLGSGSVFVGNILALTSVTVESSVVVHGRALARNGAVTLDNNVFTQPSCTASTETTAPPTTTTTTTPGPVTTTTLTPGQPAPGTSGPIDTTPSADDSPGDALNAVTTTTPSGVTTVTLPNTGRASGATATVAAIVLLLGVVLLGGASRRRRPMVTGDPR
jgi:type VI secretion system secreted protein VgrG